MDVFFFCVCVCMLMRCVTDRQAQAAVIGSSTLYVLWGWAGPWTDCDTVYTQRWCPPPSATYASAGWCLQDKDDDNYKWFKGEL